MQNIARYIEKMNNWPFCLAANIALAAGIFLCALLGRSLGIQGPALAISVVWPATGLSLAALLILGYRAGYGVFTGNFLYNALFFSTYPPSIEAGSLHAAMATTFITFGSVAQAFVSAYIMRTFSTPLFFRTVKDIFIFLIPASLLACLIGSTVGVATLFFSGDVENSLVLPLWLTFWLGDTFGIYVVTPLLVVWTLLPQEPKLSAHLPSLICMGVLFVILLLLTHHYDYPLPHLFVPISIWAAYLFRMHGASMAIFLMTASSIAFAATVQGYEGTSLISLITFIGVTIAASLLIAAIVNERAEAWALLSSRNIYLEQEADVKVDILEQVRTEAHHNRKLASLSAASEKFVEQIHTPLSNIDLLTKSSLASLEELNKILADQTKLTPEARQILSEKLQQIQRGLSDTLGSKKRISKVMETLKREETE